MKKQFKCVMAVLMACLLLSGCSKEKLAVTDGEKDVVNEKPTIGISFDSFIIERWQRDRDVFASTCIDLGAEVLVQNANGVVQEQEAQLNYFIEKGVDAIVVVPVDCYSLSDEVSKAHKAGIPVIAYDRIIMDADEDLYISFDNEKVGQYMAETLVDEMPEGGAIMKIKGPVKDKNVALINKGFDAVMAGHDNIKVISETNVPEWIAEEAYRYLASNNAMLVNVDGIMCGNDSLAGQAIRYLTEHRQIDGKAIVGQDADLDACQRIIAGTQAMTVYKPIDDLAKKAAECAVEFANDRKPDDTEIMEMDGTRVPYIGIEPIKVTKENMDEVIIDSGFHLREDVYLLD